MKRILNGLLAVSCLLLAASCADYNDTTGFYAEPDASFDNPYKNLNPVKSYIDRNTYPNMSLGAQLKVADFNKQELAHAAAVTNFDNVAFGTTLMSGAIVSEKGIMNFLAMKNLLDHVQEIGGEVFGSPIVANTNQADDWLVKLTAPIEIKVDFVDGKSVDFNEMPVGAYSGTIDKGKASIVKKDGENVLQINSAANVRILEDFEYDPKATYTATFWAKSDKDVTFRIVLSDSTVAGTYLNETWLLKGGKPTKFVVETKGREDATQGYLRIENEKKGAIFIQKVQIGYYPDNHRPQEPEEVSDTIHYALNAWCDGLMKYNEGRIKSFDLIDEPLDTKLLAGTDYYDLKHSSDKIFWQDIFGSEEYAPTVSKVAKEHFVKYGGNADDLKFFISETGLENPKKFESLKYWMGVWDAKGAQIDGINAKLSLSYSEDAATQAETENTLNTLLDNLAQTGKLIRLSNFDIKYKDATGVSVLASNITEEQRQKLADFYAYVIKKYMNTIPNDKQAGICKLNMLDTSDPVGMWSSEVVNSKGDKDWVRNATYKAFCDALSGK